MKRKSLLSLLAVSKSTVPTRRTRSSTDWLVFTFCTVPMCVCCSRLDRIPRRM